jgi:hypothetical protein
MSPRNQICRFIENGDVLVTACDGIFGSNRAMRLRSSGAVVKVDFWRTSIKGGVHLSPHRMINQHVPARDAHAIIYATLLLKNAP